MPFIEDLEKKQKIKKYTVAGLIALAIVFLAFAVYLAKKNSSSQPSADSLDNQKNTEQKRKEMLNEIKKANSESQPLTPVEEAKKQEEMQQAIEEANKKQNPIPKDETVQKAQDMLNAINEANKK